MSTLTEIEMAIRQLPKPEFFKLAEWIEEIKESEWDAQMQSDAKTGRLDFLFKEAEANRGEGKNLRWPR